MVPKPSSPARGHRNGIEQSCKEAEIADGQLRLVQAGFAQRLEGESKYRCILILRVRGSEGFDACLAEFGGMCGRGSAGLITKRKTMIAVAGHRAAAWMARQVQPAGRDRQIGPQTEFLAVAIDEHVGARAQGFTH